MNISNINNFINVKNDILKWFAHAVVQATDVTEMLRQHVDQSGSECHIVGDMSVANFKSYYICSKYIMFMD